MSLTISFCCSFNALIRIGGKAAVLVVKTIVKLLKKTGLVVSDFDVIESNEAFAAHAIAVNRGLNLDPAIVNPNGGAIALGHPVGATGTILAVKAMHELERINGRYGLVSLCIGGGQGIATIFERLDSN